jgi:signal transduction histidine kinase
MFMAVIVVTFGSIAIFISQITASAFQNYVAQQRNSHEQLMTSLVPIYQKTHDPQQVQAQVERVAQHAMIHIIVIDHDQRVIADSQRQLNGKILSFADIFALMKSQPDRSRNTPGGPPPDQAPDNNLRIISTDTPNLALGRVAVDLPSRPPQNNFTQSVNLSLELSFLVAALVALVATILLSGAILKPVQALTVAARKMEQGDLSQRVTKTNSVDELGTLAHAFNTMADSLERSEQLRKKLVSDVAHELRTPLTNIRGYLEAVRDEVTDPTPEIIDSVYEESILLSRLATDLQDLTQAEAGQLLLTRAPVAIEDIIHRAVKGIRMQAIKKGLTLNIDVSADLPLIDADAERVGQILRNLLSNAIVHTPTPGEIWVMAQQRYNMIEVRVRDTGTGIATEHLPYIFKRFYRTDPSRSRATGGSGLGLAIVEQLVHAHGGDVSVSSKPGKGTTFTFTLPVAMN